MMIWELQFPKVDSSQALNSKHLDLSRFGTRVRKCYDLTHSCYRYNLGVFDLIGMPVGIGTYLDLFYLHIKFEVPSTQRSRSSGFTLRLVCTQPDHSA